MNIHTSPAQTGISTEQAPLTAWINSQNDACFQAVENRVLRQLVQTLIFEKIIPARYDETTNASQFSVSGKTALNRDVTYIFAGQRMKSFGQVKLTGQPMRWAADNDGAPASLSSFIDEVLRHIPGTINLTPFIEELEQTLIKDVQSLSQPLAQDLSRYLSDYNALEGLIMDAHSYHACYKSRIGFTLNDNEAFGPEFRRDIELVWVAIKNDRADIGVSGDYDYQRAIDNQLTENDQSRFGRTLAQAGLDFADVRLLPVHPWQWHHKIAPTFHREIRDGTIIYLGIGEEAYRAQQSIRTLANNDNASRPYLKVAMNLTNTSSTRILANHTVRNGPVITDWLAGLLAESGAEKTPDFVILREFLGASFNYESLPEHRRASAYGSLGAVWRENVTKYLRNGEVAFPFNGLPHMQQNGKPVIDGWIKQHGLQEWTAQLIRVSVLPILHLLYAEGIGLESHGQNIVLIHKNGWPERIALKDFHDGVRYSPADLARPQKAPSLHAAPASHLKLNRNSFIITDDVNAVRDFTCDAFFFIALAEIAIFLNREYGLAESWFWQTTAGIIKDYQNQHPEHETRFAKFDVFAPTIQVEELTKRRLFGDGEARFMQVENPLHVYGARDAD
ncbi:IucA/IucC family protein [Thalassospira marina]|uniref:AcsC protein n=1 Tax=Thalassospira marina TaxID=2048283 RepID=A0ABM6QH94_9PROT|nr:IucA/IucC family protein [Thalassospira marina]AUG55978.1 AcsC protein [Thalassospira marina]